MAKWIEKLKSWAHLLKREVLTLWIAAKDDRTPWPAKLIAASVAAYALSPIDLIPDFIPVLGYLDDLVIVPLGIALAIRLIPRPLLAEFCLRASDGPEGPRSRVPAVVIVMIWLTGAAVVAYGVWRNVG